MTVIAVTKERRGGETRVAATPETVKKLIGAGFSVVVEAGSGTAASYPDADYEAAGASIAKSVQDAVGGADILFKVRAPVDEEIAALKAGAIVAATLNPYVEKDALKALADKGATAFAMEFVPRITRAQVMDVLSSQANLAGYRAVIEGAEAYGKALPMMMTAAGTVAAAKVFVMGVGVAGLQAIATARRLGAVVTATDVRPATKEQVESLGAKFIAVEDEEFKSGAAARRDRHAGRPALASRRADGQAQDPALPVVQVRPAAAQRQRKVPQARTASDSEAGGRGLGPAGRGCAPHDPQISSRRDVRR